MLLRKKTLYAGLVLLITGTCRYIINPPSTAMRFCVGLCYNLPFGFLQIISQHVHKFHPPTSKKKRIVYIEATIFVY
jgi:hypothetical protein